MNNETRTKRNLIISILIAIVGVGMLFVSFRLFGFRHDVGYQMPANEFIVVIQAFGIMALEFGTSIAGIALTAVGVIGTYNNAKKIMR